ncbi:TRAFs-binding domain-containing protein [Zoogloea sp.]|uniref:TRAFs-binding domain-containing protein n=1 Tax=Zoogloea sp. TaxID=49181 RepID=UPI0035B14289
MKLHAFVAMPFGTKPDTYGNPAHFDAIYAQLIKPAIEHAGLDVIRADEEKAGGDILEDMFQELLIADLVLVDLTADNPNVWYELGVRHALRRSGVVLVNAPRANKPFDNYTSRKYTYTLKDGAPDPATLDADIRAIAEMIRATLDSGLEKPISPVYSMLPNLAEPDWKTLRIGSVKAFWTRYEAWAALIERARRAERPEDILVLADEAPVVALRVEARLKAGKALLAGQHYHFALEQFDAALAADPANLEAARQRGLCLQRLGRLDDARGAYEQILAEHPKDVETWSLLGRLDKDAWVAAWNRPGATPRQMREDAAWNDALLLKAIDSYATAFAANPAHYYSGINAVTLLRLYADLVGRPTAYDTQFDCMAGGTGWAARCVKDDPRDGYWARATLGDLRVLLGKPDEVGEAYRFAIALADNNWFNLDSTLGQLRLLAAIGHAADNVAAGIATFERVLSRLRPPEKHWQPDKVFLFSGHMVDAPDRKSPRFPADKEPIAAAAIGATLDEQGAGGNDLALTQGASGGDLLFAEAAIARGMRVQLLLPLPEPQFITESILPASNGEAWRKRYYQLRGNPLCLPPRVMPDCLGPLPKDGHGKETSPFERCNQWLLNSALALGISRTRFICLWNGSGGDGPGGTAHMMDEVQQRTGQVTWLDTRKLW